ncbi:MAG: response regulator [Deltaproteobacteria bacterium]|nr:response regulator [Deltaproteobacteria bacterium]
MPKPRKSAADRHLRCLLVEDNPDHAQLIHERLHKKLPRLAITRVELIPEAITALKTEPFALVITSLELGHQSLGTALATLVRAAKTAPVLVLSGNTHPQTATEAKKQGSSDFHLKTRETLDQLPDIVTALLHHPARRSAPIATAAATPSPSHLAHDTVDGLVQTLNRWLDRRTAPARQHLQSLLNQLRKLQRHLGTPHPDTTAR